MKGALNLIFPRRYLIPISMALTIRSLNKTSGKTYIVAISIAKDIMLSNISICGKMNLRTKKGIFRRRDTIKNLIQYFSKITFQVPLLPAVIISMNCPYSKGTMTAIDR
jgi:hypothetical protein